MSALENIQPIEAINYFVELEVERHLERLKMAAVKEQRREKEEEKKNTVLVLPKIRRLVLYLFSHNSFTFLSFRNFMVMLPHWFSLVCVCNENLSFIKNGQIYNKKTLIGTKSDFMLLQFPFEIGIKQLSVP